MTPALRILAIALALLAGTEAFAETLRLRSGEHDGFSRIVIAGGPASGWTLRRGTDGYVFRSGRDGDVYDLAGVFDLIPRSRIADLRPREDGALDIVLGCDCHGTAFATGSGAIAIDIADGPPSGASPFEAPDQAAVPQAEPAPSGTTEAVPDTVTEQQASLVPLPSTAIPQDPHLPVYWNGPVPPPLVEPSVEEQTATAPAEAPADSLAEAAAESATPDRIPEMRDDLLEQLSRAASQGLITLDPAPTRPAPQSPAHEAPQAPEMADPVPLPEADRAPLHIETSVDRDSGFTVPAHPLTADGGQCPADEIFDVAAWAGEEPPAIQIAALRQGIVGEFDRPDPERVIALAQLYVNLGFGAEASATLDSFGIENETAAWLHSLARIVEQPGNAPPSLRGYAGCVGPVALWALLEDGGGLASSLIDIPSVLGSFSSLPLHLRVHLGPALLERLTSIGEVEAARTARAAILRAGLVETPDLGLAEARIALAEGHDTEGTRQLETIAAGNGPAATEALMQAIRLHLDKGGAVPPKLTATTGALAKEFAHDPLGPRLAVLEILGLASTGDFTTAFDEEAYWRNRLSDAQAREVLLGLFAALVGNGDDWTFFAQYFRDRDRLEAAGPDILLRLDLAERLTGAGFDTDAAAVLTGEAAGTARGRRLLARHALNAGDTDAALGQLAGLNDAAAGRLRGEAMLLRGEAERAATVFKSTGADDGAARAAWLAGDWTSAAAYDANGLAADLSALGLVRSDTADAETTQPAGELETGRNLVTEAARARDALGSLVTFAAAPEDPAPVTESQP